jgi:hypothetical protein
MTRNAVAKRRVLSTFPRGIFGASEQEGLIIC